MMNRLIHNFRSLRFSNLLQGICFACGLLAFGYPRVVYGQFNPPPQINRNGSSDSGLIQKSSRAFKYAGYQDAAGYLPESDTSNESGGNLVPPINSERDWAIYTSEQEIPNLSDQFTLFGSLALVVISLYLYYTSTLVYRKVHAIQFRQFNISLWKNKTLLRSDDIRLQALMSKGDGTESGVGCSFYFIILLFMTAWVLWIPFLRGYFWGISDWNVAWLPVIILELKNHPRDYSLMLLLVAFLGITFGLMKFYQAYSSNTPRNAMERTWARISVRGLILGLISLCADLLAIGLFLLHKQ